jgi:RNA polymerase sigma-70 factor (ECF subfamily)
VIPSILDSVVSDLELLERWGAGDAVAARELFERHFEAVHRFFRCKCANASDAEDLVQETFAACVAGRHRFRGESGFRSYLFGTARHKLLHHYRDDRQHLGLDEIAATPLVDLDPSPSSLLVAHHEERVVLEALRRLPIDAQIVIELYVWENLGGAEVAAVLGISEAAMRSRLHRAKEQLRSHIEQIATSDEVLRSTLENLEGWAIALRRGHAR